jgi:hypothetical protein
MSIVVLEHLKSAVTAAIKASQILDQEPRIVTDTGASWLEAYVYSTLPSTLRAEICMSKNDGTITVYLRKVSDCEIIARKSPRNLIQAVAMAENLLLNAAPYLEIRGYERSRVTEPLTPEEVTALLTEPEDGQDN